MITIPLMVPRIKLVNIKSYFAFLVLSHFIFRIQCVGGDVFGCRSDKRIYCSSPLVLVAAAVLVVVELRK